HADRQGRHRHDQLSMASEKPSPARICEAAEISEAARALLQPNMTAERYVSLLVERGEFADAVRFLAHSLPKREAVWWAWFCAPRLGLESAAGYLCLSGGHREMDRAAHRRQPPRRHEGRR